MKTEEHLLTILCEECAEVAQRTSKALRFGLHEVEPGQHLTNAQRIRDEFADLIAMYEMAEMEWPHRAYIEAKKDKVKKYLKYSESLGRVDSQFD